MVGNSEQVEINDPTAKLIELLSRETTHNRALLVLNQVYGYQIDYPRKKQLVDDVKSSLHIEAKELIV